MTNSGPVAELDKLRRFREAAELSGLKYHAVQRAAKRGILRLVAQLVRHAEDDDLLQAIVAAALPESYAGDTLIELSEMIAGRGEKASTKRLPMQASSR